MYSPPLTLAAPIAAGLLCLSACGPQPSVIDPPYRSAEVPLRSIECGISISPSEQTVVLSENFAKNQYRPRNLRSETLFEATRSRFQVDNCGWDGKKNPYPTVLEGCDNCSWHGGLWSSSIPQDTDWEKTYCNSAAAFSSKNSTDFSFSSVRIDGAWDGIRFQPQDSEAITTFIVEDSWLSNVRDDCIENDGLHNMVVRNSLFDGCFSGISVDPGRRDPPLTSRADTHTVVLKHVLLRLQDYPFRGNVQPGHFLKVHPASPSFEIHDSIFAFDRVGYVDRRWSQAMSKVKSCSNNQLLWLSDRPMPSDFPQVPACFAVLTGAEARYKWEESRDAWIAACDRLS